MCDEIDLTIPDFLSRKLHPELCEPWTPQTRIKSDAALVMPKRRKWKPDNPATLTLNQRLENCPLRPGTHTVDLVKLGRKWVRFRCEGRTNCVKVRRIIWDAVAS